MPVEGGLDGSRLHNIFKLDTPAPPQEKPVDRDASYKARMVDARKKVPAPKRVVSV
ncbi:hypothetical protein ES702_05106 [subsurface metagenome]